MSRDNCENKCERPFRILLLSSVVQVPQKFLHFPRKQVQEKGRVHHFCAKIIQRLKNESLMIVLLNWRLVRSDVWMVAIVPKNCFLCPGI